MMLRIFLVCLLITMCGSVFAQETSVYTNPDVDYRKGIELLGQEKYNAAQEKFRSAISRIETGNESLSHETFLNALYYDAYCSKQLNRPDAEKLFTDLVSEHEENPTTRRAYFQLADIYFDQKKYSKAIGLYKKVDPLDLSDEEKTEFNFQYGVCYFYQKDFVKAKAFFAESKDHENEYYYPSNYYYGYIAYKEGNLAEAIKSFRVAGKSELYKQVVPYYLAGINYRQGNYDAVITDASSISVTSPYYNETQLLLAKAYFANKQYNLAQKPFEIYAASKLKMSEADFYQYMFCEYKQGQYDVVISNLQTFVPKNDSIAQNSQYLLADCFLNAGRKNEARLTYESASKMDADLFVKEQSTFQFAKLSHELNFHDVSVKALQKFIADYPKSANAEEAKQYLANEFMSTNNYRDALQVLRTVSAKSPEIRRAYQKVAYSRATELYNEKDYKGCNTLMEESLKNPVDKNLEAAAYFWKGEGWYNRQQYDSAADDHNRFLFLATSKMNLPIGVTRATSNYTLGYCYLKDEAYSKAFSFLSDAKDLLASSKNEQDKRMLGDATLRCGDCQFVLRNYSGAATFYDFVITKKLTGSDYALFQKANILGLQNNTTEKITTLRKLTSDYPSSIYVDDALYELGVAYLTIPAYQDAAQTFNQVISKYPSGSYNVKSRLKLGLIYFNLDNDEQALAQYQWVLEKYPKSPEGAEALNGVKEIFTDKGDAQGYMNFVKSLPNVNVSETTQDSVVYLVAESKYSKGDCSGSIKEFNNYLNNFPQGAFAAQAHFYRGECLFRQNDFDEAITDYEYVADQPQNRFSEKALLQAARINYVQKKNYQKAYSYYQQLGNNADYKSNALEAAKGMMYSAYYLSHYNDVVSASNLVLSFTNASVDDQTEAHFYLAKAAYAGGNLDKAFSEFSIVAKASSSAAGAESAYRIAEIYFKRGELKKSEDQCWNVVKQKPSSDYWIAKSYLLIADIFVVQKDLFQAKATLQSIIDNYKGTDDIIPSARQKMEEVKAQEAVQEKPTNEEGSSENESNPEDK